ncbi:TetR/AcrR family transcriptional regulator [Streptomyces tremellae]|uniref:TetR-like C-terminal domain-containing protein n=1 Tax=Streptomyces tremellae TaxID=1124239 RepID=A0ABP7F0R7_9ACTN
MTAVGEAGGGGAASAQPAVKDPGTVRPGGRTARVRAAVLRAACDALAEHGFGRLDLTDIARRAEVGKTTVYRRWSTAAGLVADLLDSMAEQSVHRGDTGSLEGDLRAKARRVVATLNDPRQGPLFRAVIAASTGDPRTARALRRFYGTRVEEWAECVRLAVRRGEVPEGTDPHEVVRAVSAPLYHRALISGEPLDDRAADRAVAAVLAAARAGVYTRAATAD